jgi:HTH-type transcriptional regulator / antitoxin HipB
MPTYRGPVHNSEHLGMFLRGARSAKKLSQRELAASENLSQKYVWEMEDGKNILAFERLFALMRATGMRLYAEFDEPELPDVPDLANLADLPELPSKVQAATPKVPTERSEQSNEKQPTASTYRKERI